VSQRHTISGQRSGLVWLGTLFALALVVIIVVVAFLVAPDRRRQQQLEAHYKACVAFQAAGDWDKAVEACAQAVAIDAGYKDVQSRYAEVLSRQREAAATAISVAATATADALEAHYQKGLAYMDLKRWDEARAEMEQVFEIDPDYKDVQEKLAHIERASPEMAPTPTAPPSRRVVEIAAGKPATASGLLERLRPHPCLSTKLRLLTVRPMSPIAAPGIAHTGYFLITKQVGYK